MDDSGIAFRGYCDCALAVTTMCKCSMDLHKVHDHMFIVEDCKHAQTFLSFGSPHIGCAAAHGSCLNIVFLCFFKAEHVFAEHRLQWQHPQCIVAPLW